MRIGKGRAMGATLISIIGLPASGKTTLAEHLAAALPGRIIYEDYAGNPFLAEAYGGNRDAALPAQLYYLLSRVKQLRASTWPTGGFVVSDYGFCQDRIYAEQQLGGADLEAYNQVARRLEALVRPPDLMVCLDASETVLLERIARRGREFEKAMTPAFLTSLRAAYGRLPARSAGTILHVDCERTDLRKEAARAPLLGRIRQALSRLEQHDARDANLCTRAISASFAPPGTALTSSS